MSALPMLRAAHIGPAVVVTVITVALAVAAGVRPNGVAVLGAGMLAGQLSVGWSNDWLDSARDRAAGRADKPAATGEVPVRDLAIASLVVLPFALVLPFAASLPAGALHVLFVASAWSYNLGLKRTPASVLPYVVSFGSLPAIAALAHRPPALPAEWTLAAGAALGVAAHFANVVPDVADDRRAGVRGLPQLLGARAAGVVAALVLLIGVLVVGIGADADRALGGPGGAAIVLAALCAAAGLVVGLRPRPGRLPFRLVMAAALLLVVVLLLTPHALS